MAYHHPGGRALDYQPCRYGASKLLFRGPQAALDPPYAVFLGGGETFGRFIPHPFPALLEDRLGRSMINLGVVNAGVDAFLADPGVAEACAGAAVCVVQITGAANLSNRFYSVHPRRNDRFLKASSLLRSMYRDVDFTDFAFTRHLLRSLRERGPDRFAMIETELKQTWTARMRLLLHGMEERTVLLWIGPKSARTRRDQAVEDPLYVDAAMIDALPPVARYIEVLDTAEVRTSGTRGMVFTETEAMAAQATPGPQLHLDVARALTPVLEPMLGAAN